MKYRVYIMFAGHWYPIGEPFDSTHEAWWAVSRWRQESVCHTEDHFTVDSEAYNSDSVSQEADSFCLAKFEKLSRTKGE